MRNISWKFGCSIAGGIALAAASAAGAQTIPAAGPPPGVSNTGGPRPQDIAAANREVDNDYNTLAGQGVKVTDKSRADYKRKHQSVVAATAADIKPGVQIRDIKGTPVGAVATLASNETVSDPNQVVVDTGQTKIAVPLSAFGKDDKGLLLSITADKFNQLVAQAHASSEAQPASSN